jgi:branched-subunit amino acid aminotransferase/4-amino-4-deoxychorismate lyase
MSNRISTIERLNRNYKSLMGKPPLRQSLLHEDLRATQAMSGLVNATPFIQRPIISNSSVLRTVTTNTPPTIMVNAPQMVPVISTLPTVSAVTNSINVNHNYQQTHFGLDGGPKLQVVTTANSSAVQ